MSTVNVTAKHCWRFGCSGKLSFLLVGVLPLFKNFLCFIKDCVINYLQFFNSFRGDSASVIVTAVDWILQNSLNCIWLKFYTVMCKHFTVINILCHYIWAVAVLDSFLENGFYHFLFYRVNFKSQKFLSPLIDHTAFYKPISERSTSACVNSIFNKLMEASFYTHWCFLTFAVCLPEAYVIHQLVNMAVHSLFTLVDAPHFYAVLNEPLDNERGFVINSSYSVKHKYKKYVKLFIFRCCL